MVKVSVIIPVYNAAPYLKKCVTSLIKQTLDDIEIVVINDGSTDNSLQIIEDFQKIDSRIFLITQKNQGVSVARNTGLDQAVGEYIGFVDADDYVDPDMYMKLYNEVKNKNLDIVISNFIAEQDGKIIKKKSHSQVETVFNKEAIQKELIPILIQEDTLNSCWNKLYSSKLIYKNKIRFPINITNGEDGVFNIEIFNTANKLSFVEYYGYHYREVAGSATRDILHRDYFNIALNVYKHKYDFKLPMDDRIISKLKAIRFVNMVISLIHVYLKPNKKISFYQRFNYVKKMINNEVLQQALQNYWNEIIESKQAYSKFILKSIKAKSALSLLFATRYSVFRN